MTEVTRDYLGWLVMTRKDWDDLGKLVITGMTRDD